MGADAHEVRPGRPIGGQRSGLRLLDGGPSARELLRVEWALFPEPHEVRQLDGNLPEAPAQVVGRAGPDVWVGLADTLATEVPFAGNSFTRVDPVGDAALLVMAPMLGALMASLGAEPDLPSEIVMLGYDAVAVVCHLHLKRWDPDLDLTVVEPSLRRRKLAAALGARTTSTLPDTATPLRLVSGAWTGSAEVADAVQLPGQLASAGADWTSLAADAVRADPIWWRPAVTDAVTLDDVPIALRDRLVDDGAVVVIRL